MSIWILCLLDLWGIWIESLCGFFSNPEEYFQIFFLVTVGIPAFIFAATNYKATRLLEHIAQFLFRCSIGFLIIICPFSLLIFLFYKKFFKVLSWVFPRFVRFISPILKMIVHIICEVFSSIFFMISMFALMVFLPFYIPAVSFEKWIKSKRSSKDQKQTNNPQCIDHTVTEAPQEKSKETLTPASYMCRTIWLQTDLYSKCTGHYLTRTEYMYLWGVFFFIVVKAVKDQSFVNDIYSYFDKYAIDHIRDPEHRQSLINTMRQEYREIRFLLNEFEPDIFTEEGKTELWYFTEAHVLHNKILTEQDRKQFIASYHILKRTAITQHSKINPTTSTTKYSISESCEKSELPNEK